MEGRKVLYFTRSVCPVCLRELGAAVTAEKQGIFLEKSCPEHGDFRVPIWAENEENYRDWLRCGGLDPDTLPRTPEEAERRLAGFSFTDRAHARPATAALMTTNRCNLRCPVCFTRAGRETPREPSAGELRERLIAYREAEGPDAPLELCGGEPTAREDLCEIASMARGLGFSYLQLNTNGLRLAQSGEYCRELREAGVTTVYLGFDGLSEKPYLAKYGREMLAVKKTAVEHCAEAGLAVVLVMCVMPGENDGELGAVVAYAKAHMPAVRGVYFQPISYFGVYPADRMPRITIPDLIRRLAEQNPELRAEDFGPGALEHPQCSFQACYAADRAGALRPLTKRSGRGPSDIARVRASVRASWLPSKAKLLTVGGMAFQDAWNADLLRVARCTVQILQRDGTLVPLCGKYLSGAGGERLLPGID